MEYVIVAIVAMLLVGTVHLTVEAEAVGRVLPVLLVAFAVRLAVQLLVMQNHVITYGGDNMTYEARAMEVMAFWKSEGFRFVTSEDIPSLYAAAIPCNAFALVLYLCGGPAPLGCTALVAFLACALCLVIYRFAILVGADRASSLRLMTLTAFMPAFLLHTSDMFKDGFNAFLVVACLALGLSNLRRFDLRKVALLAVTMWALWYVRPYMVFMCAMPVALGFAGLKRAFSVRALLVVAALIAVLPFADLGEAPPVEAMQEQLDYGQSELVRRGNAIGGSGVTFDDGGNPWNQLGPKLMYTLFSPFPWTGGSLALQLGKIEVLVWYFLLFCAVRGAVRLWREDRMTACFLLLFVIPGTVVYATTMANVGLIFRQRMPIVMITSLLAAVAWCRQVPDEPSERPRPESEPDPEPALEPDTEPALAADTEPALEADTEGRPPLPEGALR
ncbi:hypothetical protein [Sphaerisporangium dianthi]|uniref:Glycosyltransferase RgtA/B/C/D-like domain-containing protein n=1 Tax=Sphaerisporangium dianthi TaxID=1436120 RepID=A0ABV9CFR5_9ACTN